MSIRRAVVTAASPTEKSLPLQNLVDQQGEPKTALQLIADEAVGAGVEDCLLYTSPSPRDQRGSRMPSSA